MCLNVRVNKMSVVENALFIKYLHDVKLPIEKSIKQLNKIGAVLPEHHFIKRLQFEKVNERELFKNILTEEQMKKCSFIFENYIVLHVVMVNDKKYEFVLKTELQDLTARFKEVNESVNYYLENKEEVDSNFIEYLNTSLLQIFK